MAEVALTDRLATPFDAARRAVLVAALRNQSVRALFSSRDRRVAAILGAHACAALTFTVLFPAPLLVLLPLVLGVPHVVADLRYLVLRRTARFQVRAPVLAGCAGFLGMNAFALLGARFDVARVEIGLGAFVVAAAGIAALGQVEGPSERAQRARAAFVLAGVVLLGSVALKAPRIGLVVLLHAHNWVALVVWLWLFRNRSRAVLPSLALIVGSAGLLASGILTARTLQFGMWKAFGTNLLVAADWLAPGVPGALGVGLASSFIFLQSVHYLTWLVLIPMDGSTRSGSASFRRSFRGLVADLGAPGAAAAAGVWAIVAGFGTTAPLATRSVYLALVSFHVWLELAALAFYAVRGRTDSRATTSAVPAAAIGSGYS
jgi:hypothetical protein